MRKNADPNRSDSILIAAVRNLQHYQIAGYGTARTYLEALGKEALADTLQETLDEEMRADEKLALLAEKAVNIQADIRL